MKPYPEYKDSGLEWIGMIPKHWNMDKFCRVSYMKGRIGWQGLKQSEFIDDHQLPYLITGMNFKDGIIRWEEVYHISEERYAEAPEIQLQKNDVLMTKDGTIGKLLYVDSLPNRASLNSHLLVFRPLKGEYIPRFLYYELQSEHFKNHVEHVKTGTTFYGITQEGTGQFKILLPPLPEQSQISSFLDFKTRQIDDLISKKQKLIELLLEESTAMINQAVTKGLDPDVPMKDSGIEWLGEIPEHWNVKRLKFLAKSIQTGNTPPSEKQEYYESPDIEWFTPSDFTDKLFLMNSNRKINSRAIKDGVAKLFNPFSVLIIGIGATLGKIGMIDIPASSNQQINAIEFNGMMNPAYGAYFLKTFESVIKNMSNAATLAILNQSNTKNIILTYPPKNEQDKIVEFISETYLQIESTISRIVKEIDLLSEYKTSLINEAVTGKIDVRDYHITNA
jgi:type I restriction enzyme, S subunit